MGSYFSTESKEDNRDDRLSNFIKWKIDSLPVSKEEIIEKWKENANQESGDYNFYTVIEKANEVRRTSDDFLVFTFPKNCIWYKGPGSPMNNSCRNYITDIVVEGYRYIMAYALIDEQSNRGYLIKKLWPEHPQSEIPDYTFHLYGDLDEMQIWDVYSDGINSLMNHLNNMSTLRAWTYPFDIMMELGNEDRCGIIFNREDLV